jgi:hypothetical protein
LWEFRTPTGPPAGVAANNIGSGHLGFVVDDMLTDCGILGARGLEFVGVPTEVTAGANKGGYAVYLVGPDGIRLELFQGPATPVR